MTASILTIVAAIVSFLVWLWKQHAQRKETPYAQHQQHREQLAREIIARDEVSANRRLDDDLDRLRALQSHQQQPDDPSAPRG